MRTTLIIYRKSQGKIITRFPAHMISVDDAGRVSGRGNMYLVLAQESNPDALDAWKQGAKTANASKRQNLAAELEPRGLVIARMGDNGDAVVMWDDEFAMSEHNLAYAAKLAAERKAREEMEARTVRINLVTRGWGDYGMVAWCGDITRPTAEIVAECRAQLEHDTAKDYGMSDEEITAEVEKAKAAWAAKNAKREAVAAHIEDCKRRARETGERVEIRHYATECHDQHEECSLDIVTEWAMPDGTIVKSYQHTW